MSRNGRTADRRPQLLAAPVILSIQLRYPYHLRLYCIHVRGEYAQRSSAERNAAVLEPVLRRQSKAWSRYTDDVPSSERYIVRHNHLFPRVPIGKFVPLNAFTTTGVSYCCTYRLAQPIVTPPTPATQRVTSFNTRAYIRLMLLLGATTAGLLARQPTSRRALCDATKTIKKEPVKSHEGRFHT